MELNHLKYFHVVVKEGSFTRAAKALRIQQPTISKMVRALEEQLGVPLLERHRSGVQLTWAGAEIFRKCEEIFTQVDEIKQVPGRDTGECQGALSFGSTDSVSSYVAPKILSRFILTHPKVRPSMFAGSSNLICHELEEGRIEFGLVFTRPVNDDFLVRDIVDVPFVMVGATRALGQSKVRSSTIISRDIDYPKGRPFPVLAMLRRHRIPVDVVVSSNNLDSQKQLVLEGMGVALLPRFMVKNEIRTGVLSVLHAKKEFSYSLKVITRKRRALSHSAATFLEFFTRKALQYV